MNKTITKKFSSKVYKSLNYINWKKESNVIRLSQEDFSNKYNELVNTRKLIIYTTIRYLYTNEDVFSIKVSSNYRIMYLKENDKYIRYSTNEFDNTKNDQEEYQGSKAIVQFISKFKELKDTTLYKAFGTVEEEFKRCVPKQFYYINNDYLHKEVIASSIDGCSQYPSNMCGRLPDSHTMITINGRVEPNEEYPFAFYKSGHVAEYRVFDTHNWRFSPYFDQLFRFVKDWPILNLRDSEEVTYLMKASDYQLNDVWEYFYNRRKTDQNAKLVMNSAIGMMHTEKYKSYKYAHLVAIAIARGNQKILNMCERIGNKNILHICVDGIIYLGDKIFGVDYKGLGVFNQEFNNCNFLMSSMNKYIAMKDGNCIKAKHGNCNVNIIPDNEIKKLTDQYKWIFINPLEGVNNGESL